MSELYGRLLALREALDAVIDLVEKKDAPPVSGCRHPLESRQYRGDTMGDETYVCQQCGAVIAPVVESVQSIVDRVTRSTHSLKE